MPCKTNPSFIIELLLKTSPADERAGVIILDAARNGSLEERPCWSDREAGDTVALAAFASGESLRER
jgi:hypothetical protein